MKKFFIFAAIAVALSACAKSSSYSEEQAKEKTTLEITEHIDTTYTVSIVGGKAYLFKDDILTEKCTITTNSHIVCIPFGALALSCAIALMGGFIFGLALAD